MNLVVKDNTVWQKKPRLWNYKIQLFIPLCYLCISKILHWTLAHDLKQVFEMPSVLHWLQNLLPPSMFFIASKRINKNFIIKRKLAHRF